jgi:hypothetical protein
MTAYNKDRFAWSEEQAKLLLDRKRTGLDREHIAAEIEELGEADLAELLDRMTILLKWLLLWAYDVDLRSRSLSSLILRQRRAIEDLIEDSVSLASRAHKLIVEVYPAARRAASIEHGPFEDSFFRWPPFPAGGGP